MGDRKVEHTDLAKQITGFSSNEPHKIIINQPPGKVWVRFTDRRGEPVKDTACRLIPRGGAPLEGMTDGQGEVKWEPLRMTLYKVELAGEGWKLATEVPWLKKDSPLHLQPIRKPNLRPMATELAWSQPRVQVGDPVQLSFKVKNCVGGEKAQVHIYEHDADGSHDLVETIEHTVADASGACQLSWTCSEEEADEQLEEDALSGETGPLDFRFLVEFESSTSRLSGSLNLLTTVEFEGTFEDGTPVPEGALVTLVAANGESRTLPVQNGQVVFRDVVVGPTEISLQQDGGRHGR